MKTSTVLQLLPCLLLAGTFSGSTQASELPGKPRIIPTIQVDVSAALINAVVQRAVDRLEPVQEIIQGTPVTGLSHTQGIVTVELLSHPTQAVVDICLRGLVSSRTVASRQPVFIHTATTTPLEVRQQVVITSQGIRTFPGPWNAASRTSLIGIINQHGGTGTPATEIAREGFAQRREAAEAETAQKTAWRSSQRLGEDLAPGLHAASQAVSRGLKGIQQAGFALEGVDFKTTPGFLQARLRSATAVHSQSFPPTPELPADLDLGFRIHHSALNEATQSAYGGKAFAVLDLGPFLGKLTRGVIRDARPESAQKTALASLVKLLAAWAGKSTIITFTQQDPLRVTFTEEGLVVAIQIAAIQHNGQAFSGFRVESAYRLENTQDGVLAVRKGLPIFAALPGTKLPEPPAAFLALREVLFGEVVKERLLLTAAPAPDSLPRVRFQAPQASTCPGWLTLAWKLQR